MNIDLKLKPCPFCGDKAQLVLDKHHGDDDMRMWSVECVRGCANSNGFFEDDEQTAENAFEDIMATITKAVSLWNRRVGN